MCPLQEHQKTALGNVIWPAPAFTLDRVRERAKMKAGTSFFFA